MRAENETVFKEFTRRFPLAQCESPLAASHSATGCIGLAGGQCRCHSARGRGHRLTVHISERSTHTVGGSVRFGSVGLWCLFVCLFADWLRGCLWRRIGLHGFSTRVLRAGTCLSRMRRTTSTCSTRKPTVRPAGVEALCCVPHSERAEDLQHAVCHMRHASNDMQPASDRMSAT